MSQPGAARRSIGADEDDEDACRRPDEFDGCGGGGGAKTATGATTGGREGGDGAGTGRGGAGAAACATAGAAAEDPANNVAKVPSTALIQLESSAYEGGAASTGSGG